MTYYNYQEIFNRAALDGISIKPNRMRDIVEKYHSVVCAELIYGFYMHADMSQINANTVPFSLKRVREEFNHRYGTKPQQYWWDWLHENFPLVREIKKGYSVNKNTKTYSIVESTVPLEHILASQDPAQVMTDVYSRYNTDSDIHHVQMDMRSLNRYIRATAAVLQNNRAPNQTIMNNLKTARLLHMIGEYTGGALPQVVNTSEFGRTYYRGPNLQNCHKTVRHAALGTCVQVDINASVFNWKYSIAVDLGVDPSQLLYTRELIEDKTIVRKRLAQLLFGNTNELSIDTVKQIITAIGFGARVAKGNPYRLNSRGEWESYNAIADIIRSKNKRDNFFADSWVKQFVNEQRLINRRIFEEIKTNIQDLTVDETLVLRTESKKLNENRAVAWAYQNAEAQVMQELLKLVDADQLLLQVHDCFYFSRLSNDQWLDMQMLLKQHWCLASMSKETVNAYQYQDVEFLEQHRAHIRAEERAANPEGWQPARQATVLSDKTDKGVYTGQTLAEYEAQQTERFNQHFGTDPMIDRINKLKGK